MLPHTIFIEPINDIKEGFHEHIDMIYFCTLIEKCNSLKSGWIWVHKEDILKKLPLKTPEGSFEIIPKDVRSLAIKSFEFVENI